jgi:hypothetical protein
MKLCYLFRIIAAMLLGSSSLSLVAGDIPAFTKKKSLRMLEKFTELKNPDTKMTGNKNTYVVKDQMLHLYNGVDYDTTSSFHYQYVWSVLVSEKLTKDYFNGAFENSQLELYFKDDEGRDTALIYQFWNTMTNSWNNITKIVIHFDDQGNEVFQGYYLWDQEAWVLDFGSQMDYEYDTQDRVLSITYSYYMGNVWYPYWRDLFEYEFNDLLSAMTEQYWDSWENDWVNDYREEYLYANNEWSELFGYYWDDWGEEWIPDMWAKDIVWVDFSAFLWAEVTILEYDGMNWVNSERGFASYNALNMPLVIQFEIWFGGAWVNDWKVTWEYDSFYNITLMKEEMWSGIGWEVYWGERYIYEYDEFDNIAVEYFEEYYYWVKFWEKVYKLESWYEDVTGIQPVHNESFSINVFPNPAGNMVNIQLDDYVPGLPVYYQMLDITGRTVMSGQHDSNGGGSVQLNIQDIPAGVYILRVESMNIIETVKIIKR